MSQLEALLRRAGRLRKDQLEAARNAVETEGLSWVDSLIERASLDEQDLVAFVQSKLLIPRVDASVLADVNRDLCALVSSELAHRYELLPVAHDELGNLTIAMVDPTDDRGVTEVANATGGYVIRAAAPRTALRAAIKRVYGPAEQDPSAPTSPTTPPEPAPTSANAPESEASPSGTETTSMPSNPDFAAIEEAADHQALTQAIFDILHPRVRRLLLFVHTRDELRGQDARGEDLRIEEIRKIRIPSGIPSRFAGVIAQRRPYLGPMGRATEVDRRLDHAMRGIDGLVLIFPVVLGERVPLLLFGHRIQGQIDAKELRELSAAVSKGLRNVIANSRSGDAAAAVT